MLRGLISTTFFILSFAGNLAAEETMVGVWTGTWSLDVAEPIAADVMLPDTLPESRRIRLEMQAEIVDFFFDAAGLAFVDSTRYGSVSPLNVSESGEVTGWMQLLQGPRGFLATIDGVLIEPDRFEGTMAGAVCIEASTCDRAFSEPPLYYNRLGRLELTRSVPEPSGLPPLLLATVFTFNAQRHRRKRQPISEFEA